MWYIDQYGQILLDETGYWSKFTMPNISSRTYPYYAAPLGRYFSGYPWSILD